MPVRAVALAFMSLTLAALPGRARALEPVKVWGTYLGGTFLESSRALVTDGEGNVYLAGNSQYGGISTPGAFKDCPTDYVTDAFLARFTPDGQQVWGTCFGGGKFESTTSVVIAGDKVVIAGRTHSATGIAFGGTFQSELEGNENGFVAAFTLDGAFAWGTYVPSARSIASGSAGEIYVGGSLSTSDAVASGSPHQSLPGGGVDGFILKLDPTGNKVWGTYYGGAEDEEILSLARVGGVLYIGGETLSDTGIATDGAFQPQRFSNPDVAEGRDLFLAAFDEDGARAWGTYFGGENADTTARVAADPGGVALIGRSKSSGVATNGSVHLDPFNLIVARFDVTGQRVWSAYFGGGEEDAETSITTHTDGSVYVGGYTASTMNIVTPDAAYPEFSDEYSKNGFVAKLDRASGDVVWASYYPFKGNVGALHYAASALYLAGSTTQETDIATPGTAQEQLAGEADCYLVRLEAPAAPGGGCVVAGDCPSELCVDGVCCDSPCGDGDDGDCQACSVAAGGAVDGTCGPVLAGGVCRPSAADCDAAESCDGRGLDCPPDVLADDGAPCPDGHCEAGACVPGEGSSGATTSSASDTTAGPPPTGTDAGEDDTAATPTSSFTTDAAPTGDAPTGGAQTGDGGCGCTSAAPPGLALLLLAPRRRRHAAGSTDRSSR